MSSSPCVLHDRTSSAKILFVQQPSSFGSLHWNMLSLDALKCAISAKQWERAGESGKRLSKEILLIQQKYLLALFAKKACKLQLFSASRMPDLDQDVTRSGSNSNS